MAERKTKSSVRRQNFLTMLLSVVIAVLAWLVLSMTFFSDIQKTLRDVPIDFSLEGSYADILGLTVVKSDIESVNVSFEGQRGSVGNYNADDIRVSLDLNNVRASGAYDIPLVVESVNGDQITNIEIGPQKTVHIEFDRIATRTLSVESGTLMADMSNINAVEGYIIADEEIQISPSHISISGPQDIIDQITSCVISFSDAKRLISTAQLKTNSINMYSGNMIFQNPGVSIDTDEFEVIVPVYISKEMPLTLTIQNYTDNIDTSDIEYTMSEKTVLIRSQNTDINNMESISVGYVDIRNIRPGYISYYNVPVSSYYENISGVESVRVQFDLPGYAEKNITLNNSQIHTINGSSDYNVIIETDRINVTVVGPEDVLDTLDSSNFVAEINLMDYNLSVGQRFFSVTIYAPGYRNVWALGVSNQVLASIEAADVGDEHSEEVED